MTPLQKSILNAVKRRPMTLRELQNNLQVDNSRLRTTVSAMVATGELSMRNGTYVPGFATYENAAAPNTIPCTLVKLAARFGFASRDDGEGDIFIPGRALHGAMPNDKINVKLFDHPRVEGSSEGEVVEVTVPNNRFAGTVCLSEDGRMAVEPDGCRDVKFLLAKQGSEGVHLGDKVGFLITHRGNRHSDHRAAVVEKFGSSDYASECAKAILYGRSVRQEFPPEVLEEALSCPRRSVSLEVSTRNIMSVNVPVFTFQTDSGDDALLPYGFAQTSGELDDALEKLARVFEDMLELAQVEKTMQLLAQEIEKTRRRVNALEYVMIPDLQKNIKYISMKLEENENSTKVRLMKVKEMVLQDAHHYQY